jgi:hypothetical protein
MKPKSRRGFPLRKPPVWLGLPGSICGSQSQFLNPATRVCGLADTWRVAELGRVLINAQIAVPLWGHVPR